MKKFLSIILSTVIMLTAVLGFNLTASAYSIDFSSAEEYVPGEEATCEFNEYHYGVYYVELPNSAYLLQSYGYYGETKLYIYDVDDTSRPVVVDTVSQSVDDLRDLYLVAGEYYFVFEDMERDCESVDFCFEVQESGESFPESTSNNDNSTSDANFVELTETYNGMLAANDYEDFYKFSVSNSGSYTVNVEPTDGRVIRCSLYKADGTTNVGAWSVGGDYSTDLQSFNLDAGTYFLKIYTSQYGGMYKFSVDTAELPDETPVDPDVDDDDYTDEQPTEPSNGGINQVDTGHISLPTTPEPTPAPTPTTQPAASEPTASAPAQNGGITNPDVGTIHLHSYDLAYTVAATTSSKGYDVYACSCGDSYQTNFTAALPLSKVKLKSLKATGKKKIQVKWNKKSGADGYQVCWSTSKNFKNSKKGIINGGQKTSATIKKLKKGKKYYVRVRAFKYVDGVKVLGSWSSVKSVKCK